VGQMFCIYEVVSFALTSAETQILKHTKCKPNARWWFHLVLCYPSGTGPCQEASCQGRRLALFPWPWGERVGTSYTSGMRLSQRTMLWWDNLVLGSMADDHQVTWWLQIAWNGVAWAVRDSGSTNGTAVNGQKLQPLGMGGV